MSDKKKIRMILSAFDHKILDEAVVSICETAKKTGAKVIGPVVLPNKKSLYSVLRSPFIYKTSMDQFSMKTSRRLLDIICSSGTIDALCNMSISSGIEVKMKVPQ